MGVGWEHGIQLVLNTEPQWGEGEEM